MPRHLTPTSGRVRSLLTLVLAATATTATAAPPTDITEPRTIVGKLVDAGPDFVLIGTTVEEDLAATPANVRVPYRESTTILLNNEPAEWRDLRTGDSVRIVPFEDAPGVARKITAARVDAASPRDAKQAALENRTADAAARLADEARRRVREETHEGHPLTHGRVYVIELPVDSAAARAGFLPGDVVVFARAGTRDAALLRGLTGRRTNLGARFVIDDLDPEVEVDRLDRGVRVRERIEIERGDDGPDVKIEIDRD